MGDNFIISKLYLQNVQLTNTLQMTDYKLDSAVDASRIIAEQERFGTGLASPW